MIVLSGASLVLPDRVLSPGTLVIDDGRIAEIRPDAPSGEPFGVRLFTATTSCPGSSTSTFTASTASTRSDPAPATARSRRSPRGCRATASPLSVRPPSRAARRRCGACWTRCGTRAPSPAPRSARVLPAHLESNFINPDYAARSRRVLAIAARSLCGSRTCSRARLRNLASAGDFSAADILAEIERAAPDVGIVTLASELDGGLDLLRWLASRGHRVSLGHSAATYEEALAAIAAGARHATHLFNRMPPLAPPRAGPCRRGAAERRDRGGNHLRRLFTSTLH